MQENKIFQNNIKRPVFNIVNITSVKPKLVISEKVKSEIQYLNDQSPHKEWSGVLFYTLEGSLDDPKNIIMYAQGILPKDIGTAASTKYEYGEDVTQYLIIKAEELGIDFEEIVTTWKIGHHHSHCSMGVTPSSTDKEEVEDNIKNHVAYLTSISNNRLDISCFLSVYNKTETIIKFEDFNSNVLTRTNEEDGIIKFEVSVEWESNINVNNWFKEKVKELEDKSKITIDNYHNYDYTGRKIISFNEKEKDYKKLMDEIKTEVNDNTTDNSMIEYSLIEVMLPLTSSVDLQEIETIKEAIQEVIKLYNRAIAKQEFFKNYFDKVNELFEENIKFWYGDLTISEYISLIEEYIECFKKEELKEWQAKLFKNNFENLLIKYNKKLNMELMNS